MDELFPQFNGKWLMEGKTQYPGLMAAGGKKYRIHGNIIRSDAEEGRNSRGFMGISYWVDVTDYDDIKIEYEGSRPVVATIVIDNYDELIKNQPDRIKNELRDSVEDLIVQWCDGKDAILQRYDRDRYLFIFEGRWLTQLEEEKFALLGQSPGGC
jgi:c-di-AMP phosphodiesterase-like protein